MHCPDNNTHAIIRLQERYGMEMSADEFAALVCSLACNEYAQNPRYVRLFTQSCGREKWAMWYKGEWIPIVYNPLHGQVVTVLPKIALRNHSWKLPW